MVVLNSLTRPGDHTGAQVPRAVSARFVEDRQDRHLSQRRASGSSGLGENISLFVVDVDRMAAQKPALHARLFGKIADLLNEGRLAALARHRIRDRRTRQGRCAS